MTNYVGFEKVRNFNRINDPFPGLNHPIGEARLLWEIRREAQPFWKYRVGLGLESDCLSRELRSLEK
jgi:hypothetical protein